MKSNQITSESLKGDCLCELSWHCSSALPVASGVLLAACYPPLDWEFLAWIALVPFAFAMAIPRGSIGIYLGSYVCGLLFQLAHLDWIRTGYGDAGFTGPRAVQWLWQGALLAPLWPLAMFAGRRFIHRLHLPMAIAFPLTWIAFEFGRKHLWSIVDATGYPFGQLGLTQTHQPRLIQIADLGGVYTVSALVACVNGFLADVTQWLVWRRGKVPGRFPALAALVAVAAFCGSWIYGAWRVSQVITQNGPLVCLMPEHTLSAFAGPESDGSGQMVQRGWQELEFEANDIQRPDLLLWSETAYPRDIEGPWPTAGSANSSPVAAGVRATEFVTSAADDYSKLAANETATQQAASEPSSTEKNVSPRERMELSAQKINASLVFGYDRTIDHGGRPRAFNSAAFIDARRGYLGSYDKVWLIPFSEFHPPGRPTFGGPSPDRYLHGAQFPVFVTASGHERLPCRVAITICYDMCFPESCWPYMQSASGEPPDCFVVPAFESHDVQYRLQKLILRLAQFRAIECRRAFARNAKGGYSGIIDGTGALISQTPECDFDCPIMVGRMPIDNRYSLYAVWHDWMPVTALALVAVFGVWPQRIEIARAGGAGDRGTAVPISRPK